MDRKKPTCDVAWLSGIIDGEGCFFISIKKPKLTKTVSIGLKFSIAMSRGKWEQKVIQIFDKYDIKHSTRVKRGLFEIAVNSNPQVKKLCDIIKDDSVVKKDIVDRFLNFQSVGYTRNQYRNHDESTIRRIADDVDFVRSFNRKRNVPYVWDGKKIMESFGY